MKIDKDKNFDASRRGLSNHSDFGDGPEDRYLVRDSKTAALQTGCFVLRPGREKIAFEALLLFSKLLPEEDDRKEKLVSWLGRLNTMYKEK